MLLPTHAKFRKFMFREWHSRGRRFDPAWLHHICLRASALRPVASPFRKGHEKAENEVVVSS
jgi:hypothetical protein